MADESAIAGEAEAEAVEMRPCSFCGNPVHPSSHRCTHCNGHVGLGWGTVHGELFLFLFLAVLVAVGCLASWTGRTPDASAKMVQAAVDKATDRMNKVYEAAVRSAGTGPVPSRQDPQFDAKPTEADIAAWDIIVPSGPKITGLDTLRGALMFAIAVYGIFVAIFNLLYRRLVMWPFVISGMLALWVGLSGIFSAAKSAAWDRWSAWGKTQNLSEEILARIRAIPPGHLLLTIAGIVLMIKLIGGILAAASKGKPGGGADDKEGGAGARRRRGGKPGEGDATGPGEATAPSTPPAAPK